MATVDLTKENFSTDFPNNNVFTKILATVPSGMVIDGSGWTLGDVIPAGTPILENGKPMTISSGSTFEDATFSTEEYPIGLLGRSIRKGTAVVDVVASGVIKKSLFPFMAVAKATRTADRPNWLPLGITMV